MTKNDLRLTLSARTAIRREVDVLSEILVALTPLTFEERRRVLRWTCDRYGLDPTKLPLPTP